MAPFSPVSLTLYNLDNQEVNHWEEQESRQGRVGDSDTVLYSVGNIAS